ncbi:MAG: enoyl-CoA hydratase/isomerase family protein [Actinobacteria bacterium]|nr:enoyl-CoA hydratase/isomerase family protein [Actinomycetota bacterium]
MSLWAVERRGDGIVVAAYTNPPMNYFVAAGVEELAALIPSWRDPAVRAVIITGGPADQYLTHYSVEELAALAADRETMRALGTDVNDGYHALVQDLSDLEVPVIAAMSGDTMGGGLELSLGCDIRIAKRGDFSIGFPEVSLGIIPGGGGTQRLPRIIGAGPALDFVLRSRIVSPQQALALGIVSELADDPRARALEVAASLVRQSPTALAAAKRAVLRGSSLPLAEGLRVEADAFLATMLSDEAVAAMSEYAGTPDADRRAWARSRATAVPGDPS